MSRVGFLTMALSTLLAWPLTAQEEKEAPTLPAVEVEAEVEEDASKSKTVLTEEAMHGQHAMNLNDYLLGGVPGVSTSRRSNFGFSGPGAGFFIRGLTGTRVAVFVDGVPSQVNSHGHPRTDQYSPDMIDRVELTRGPSAVLHGPSAVGGVVEVFTRRPEPGFSGYAQAQVGELDTRLFQGDAAYGWDGGYALFSAMERATDAQTIGEGFDLLNLNLNVRQRVAGEWTAGFRFNNTEEEPSDRFGDDPDELFFRFTEDLTTYVASLERESGASSTLVAFAHNELDTGSFRETRAGGRMNESERVEREIRLNARHGWILQGRHGVTLGGEWVEYTDETPKGAEEIEESHVSGFVHATTRLGDRVGLDGGARVTSGDHFETDVSPELGAVFDATPTLSLRARGGKAFRVPRVGEANSAVINEDLEPEDFAHAEIGANVRAGGRADFDLVVWWMEGDNLIQRVGTGPTQTSLNTGDFSHQGLEATVTVLATPDLSLLFGVGLVDVDEGTRHVPQQTVDLGADWRRGPARATLIGRWAGDNSSDTIDDWFAADLRVQYDLIDGLRFLFDVVNVTDEEFATITAGPNQTPLEQVPRTVLAGVRWEWGPR